MMGLVPLSEEEKGLELCLPVCEKGGHLQTRTTALTRTHPPWHPNPRLLTSKLIGNKSTV